MQKILYTLITFRIFCSFHYECVSRLQGCFFEKLFSVFQTVLARSNSFSCSFKQLFLLFQADVRALFTNFGRSLLILQVVLKGYSLLCSFKWLLLLPQRIAFGSSKSSFDFKELLFQKGALTLFTDFGRLPSLLKVFLNGYSCFALSKQFFSSFILFFQKGTLTFFTDFDFALSKSCFFKNLFLLFQTVLLVEIVFLLFKIILLVLPKSYSCSFQLSWKVTLTTLSNFERLFLLFSFKWLLVLSK